MSAWQSLIGQLPFAWAQYTFMQNALLAVLIATPLFALLGCLVVNNQMAFFSDVIGHASLTGLAIGVLLGLSDPSPVMLLFGALLALAIVLLRRWSAASADTAMGLVMAFALALGVVLLTRGGGFGRYSRFLVGDILTITGPEIGRLLLLAVAVLAVWLLLFNRLLLAGMHRALASSRGVGVWQMETLFAVLVALTVTLCIPWIGLLVINSLLILPAAAARNLARTVREYTRWAVLIGLTAGVAGLISSYYLATATGATIVLYAMVLFVATLPFRRT
jgi:zinc transport system permease protein